MTRAIIGPSKGATGLRHTWTEGVTEAVNRGNLNALQLFQPPGTDADATTTARPFTVVTEQLNHIDCTDGTATIAVAKPPTLRGNVATRTGNVEPQEIFPAYANGDTIWAVSTSTGVAGVIYLDLNVDARQWAEPPPP